jgi:hypothetical protein
MRFAPAAHIEGLPRTLNAGGMALIRVTSEFFATLRENTIDIASSAGKAGELPTSLPGTSPIRSPWRSFSGEGMQ